MSQFTEFFSSLFGGKKNKQLKQENTIFYQPLSMFLGGQSEVDRNMNATFTSAVNASASFISKIKPCVVSKDGTNPRGIKNLNRLLTLAPNEGQTATRFWNYSGKSYMTDNISIIFIERDMKSADLEPIAFYPLIIGENISRVATDPNGKLFCEFKYKGNVRMASSDDLIILQRDAQLGDIIGGYSKALDNSLKVISANYDSAVSAVMASQYVRYIATSTAPIRDELKEQAQKEIEASFKNAKTGIAFMNAGISLKEVSNAGKWIPDTDLSGYKEDIYNYLGTPKEIVSGKFNENDYQSYSERTLEPYCSQLADELTLKCLSQRQRDRGLRIEVTTDPLSPASLETRIKVATAMMALPTVVPNDVLRLLHQPTIEGGDEPQSSLNWVNGNLKDQYQMETEPADTKEDTKDAE